MATMVCVDCNLEIERTSGFQKRCKSCSETHKKFVEKNYKDNHKEESRNNWSKWYQKNKDAVCEKAMVRHFENHEAVCKKLQYYARTIDARFKYSIRNARKRNKCWEIPIEEYEVLLSNPCYYCGNPLGATAIGLDRSDSTKGYLLDNVVPCCKRCNFRKGNLESAGFQYPRTVELMRELVEMWKAV